MSGWLSAGGSREGRGWTNTDRGQGLGCKRRRRELVVTTGKEAGGERGDCFNDDKGTTVLLQVNLNQTSEFNFKHSPSSGN